MVVLECVGVQYVAEVTAAFTIDPCSAILPAWGWLVPSLQMQYSPHGLKRMDTV